MLIGEYTHSLDEKSRISLPSKFRKELGEKVIITRGLDNCLFLYSLEEWGEISEKVGALGLSKADKRGLTRYLFSGAQEVDVDKQGRILIPEFLKKLASIKTKVVFTGVYDRVELWSERTWKEYRATLEKQGERLAEQLSDQERSDV